jgi:transposase
LAPVFELENATYEEVVAARDRAKTRQEYTRFFLLESVYRGNDLDEVMEILSVSRATCYRWVKRFNDRGIDGLTPKRSPGRPPKIDESLGAKIISLVADPESVQELHWTAVKLHGYLKNEFQAQFSYCTLWRYLYDNDVRFRVPRKMPTEQDSQERQLFLEKLRIAYESPTNSIYFLDEAGFEGDPKPRRQWIVAGKEKPVGYTGDHIRTNVIGSVAPKTGDFFSLIVPYVDQSVFQQYLDHLAKHTRGDNQVIVVLDNASWHKSPSLNWHHMHPLFLPPRLR